MRFLQVLFLSMLVLVVAYEDDWEDFLYGSGSGLDEQADPSASMIIVTAVFRWIITCVGLIVNGIVLFVIFCSGEANKSVTALYVTQLAIADSIFLISLPFMGSQQMDGWKFGSGMCTFCQSAKFLNFFAGIFFLTTMSVDRYVAVAYSTRSNQLRTKTRSRMICFIVWLSSLMMSLPAILYAKVQHLEELNGGATCIIMYPGYTKYNSSSSSQYFEELFNSKYETFNASQDNSNSNYSSNSSDYYPSPDYIDQFADNNSTCNFINEPHVFVVIEIIKFIVGFIIPFIIITVSYIFIVKKLLESEKKLLTTFGKRTQNMNKRVTRMVAVLILCFATCWLPYHIYRFLRIKGLPLKFHTCILIENILVNLGYSNSMLNPILYTFLGNKFPERLRESFEKTKRSLSQGGWVLSSQYNVTKKSNQRPSTTKRVTDLSPAAQVTTGCDTVMTENQVVRDGQKINLIEMSQRKPTGSALTSASEQNEKSPCLSRS